MQDRGRLWEAEAVLGSMIGPGATRSNGESKALIVCHASINGPQSAAKSLAGLLERLTRFPPSKSIR